jgi:hypothetical protein
MTQNKKKIEEMGYSFQKRDVLFLELEASSSFLEFRVRARIRIQNWLRIKSNAKESFFSVAIYDCSIILDRTRPESIRLKYDRSEALLGRWPMSQPHASLYFLGTKYQTELSPYSVN